MNKLLTPHNLNRPVKDFAEPVETTLLADLSIAQALADLHTRRIEQKIIYFYVVDKDMRLLGVIPTRNLLLASPDKKLTEVMLSPVFSLSATTTLGAALKHFDRHRLLALPVVDEEGILLGTIGVELYAEEAIDLAEARRASDLFQMIGFSVEMARKETALVGFSRRMPWQLCTRPPGIACALIGAIFHRVLSQVILVAVFIPMVLTLSESISMQSVTLTLQYLHGNRPPWRTLRKRFLREVQIVALLGITSGVLVALTASFWGGGPVPAATLAASVMISMILSASVGILMPLGLNVLHMDPRVAAGPVVLMFGDVLTTAIYFALGTWWLL